MKSVPWQYGQCRTCMIMMSLDEGEECSDYRIPEEHSRPTPLKHLQLPDVGETLQVRDHVAHPVDVLRRQHPLGAVVILHVMLVPGHRVADGAPEVPALALQHPSVLQGHDGVSTAA